MNAPLFSGSTFRAVEIGEADLPALQRFFEANPEYFHRVAGEDPAADEARQVFESRPPADWPHGRMWHLRFLDGQGETVAMAELVSDLFAEGVWHIGLFVVATRLHRTGSSALLYEGLEGWMRGRGVRWLRLNVASGNRPAERFWEKSGYTEVRRRDGVDIGTRIHTMRVMTKPLANGSMAEYLDLVTRDRPGAP